MNSISIAFALVMLATQVACGPRFSPNGPGSDPATNIAPPSDTTSDTASATAVEPSPSPPAQAAPTKPLAREILIGEMCPRGAAGRAAVLPLFLRTLHWSADNDEVSLPIERRTARTFSVIGWNGRRAGLFSVAGAADIRGTGRKAAIGSYAGTSPCAAVDGNGDSDASRTDPACVEAQAGCGLAVAVVEPGGTRSRPYEEDAEPLELPRAGACVAGDKLLVDIDADGTREAYLASAFLDPARAPAEEVFAVSSGGATCTPSFARHHVIPPKNPKHFRGLDIIGVVDIDADGRNEIIVVYHYSDRRTWAVYSASATVARLDLVEEAVPWPYR